MTIARRSTACSARTGLRWRDLPERFGSWITVYKRHRRWSADGTWQMLLTAIQTEQDGEGRVDWDISVDSTTVRAHQHAAGAPRTPPPASPSPAPGRKKRGRRRDKPGRSAAGHADGPAGRGGQAGECSGRSRGGFTTKIHLSADGHCRVLSLVLTPGQYGDSPQLRRVLGHIRIPRLGPGRPRTRPDSLAADKAYSSRVNGAYLRCRKIRHTIPEPRDHAPTGPPRLGRRTTHRLRRQRYKGRNVVERAINRLKNFRAVATRYDKRAYIFLGTVTMAALVI
ncbi:IS5 family transposase [Nonomuraea sp. NPDC049028]|uniref:IS5 family transposase n=1 Tax=Nonomuraea sp. NPDC049028 TaxID=3364348 RepID=UPI00371F356F